MSLAAVALGATIIEKHFTDTKTEKDLTSHAQWTQTNSNTL